MKSTVVICALSGLFASAGPGIGAEAWTRTTQANGAAVYACTAPDCSRGATLSCRVVPPETVATIEAFTARIDKQIADLRAVGREIEARPATRTAMGERVLYRAALFYGSGAPAFETGVLVGPREGFAVISTATDAKAMKRNFDRFLARLTKPPGGSGAVECPP